VQTSGCGSGTPSAKQTTTRALRHPISLRSAQSQDEVHARVRRHGLTQLTNGQRKRRALKRGLHLATPKLSQISPPPGTAAVALNAGQVSKALRQLIGAGFARQQLHTECLGVEEVVGGGEQ